MKNAYRDPSLPVKDRVANLLSLMTLEEKIYQLMGMWNGGTEEFPDEFWNDPEKMKATLGRGVHSFHSTFANIKDTVEFRNKIQKYLVEETRLGIPAIFVDEGQHGLMRREATVFPQAIGMSCSWNPELFGKVYSVVAHEMRSRGTHHALTPVIDICRDPRWGRVEETYGEDTYLCGVLGTAAVIGLQGSKDGEINPDHVGATLKHFVGHGQAEGGINQGPTNFSERVLREAHMAPFKTAIDEAKPLAMMPSYNEVDGIPSHHNKWLIKEILRGEWKYEGMIVSDYYAIDHTIHKHFVASDGKDAAEKAFNAGVQYEFPHDNYYRHLPDLLKEGKIREKDIDDAVSQILRFKFELGLFENPYVDLDEAIKVSKDPDTRKLALEAAHESIVLLKNDHLLPLDKSKYKSIAVIGPCAKDVYFGGYAGDPYQSVNILDGIKAKVGKDTEVLFAQGVEFTKNKNIPHMNWKLDPIELADRDANLGLIEEAVEVAKKAEIIILAIGENEQLCREAWATTHLGDNSTLDLICEQDELVKAIVALGKPVVVYLMNGRPLTINYIHEKVPAIVEGWYMGQETGTAVADVLFGDVNPSGKLTITFPRSVGQLPMYYNHKPTAQYHNYISESIKPLYPFGYGLSYTTFKIGKPVLTKETIKNGESTTLNVEVTNTGNVAGKEVVQIYIRDKVSSVSRPVKELKGFKKISLQPGETKSISLEIKPGHLAFYNVDMKYVVEPGEFEIMVGNSSDDEGMQRVVLRVL